MPEEATLDAFLADTDAGDESERGSDSGESPDGDAADVPPPDVTSSWIGDAGTCPSCGDEAARLWRDAEQLVCAACKSWIRGEGAGDQ